MGTEKSNIGGGGIISPQNGDPYQTIIHLSIQNKCCKFEYMYIKKKTTNTAPLQKESL